MFYIEGEGIDNAAVEERIARILSYLGKDGDFSVHFISDDEIRKLNSEYRGKDEPTDILTFAISDGDSFPEVEGEPLDLGDVFISLESMRRNAAAFSVTEDEELSRLLIHGILHLLGYDHATKDFSAEPMLIRQEEMMRTLGFVHDIG